MIKTMIGYFLIAAMWFLFGIYTSQNIYVNSEKNKMIVLFGIMIALTAILFIVYIAVV